MEKVLNHEQTAAIVQGEIRKGANLLGISVDESFLTMQAMGTLRSMERYSLQQYVDAVSKITDHRLRTRRLNDLSRIYAKCGLTTFRQLCPQEGAKHLVLTQNSDDGLLSPLTLQLTHITQVPKAHDPESLMIADTIPVASFVFGTREYICNPHRPGFAYPNFPTEQAIVNMDALGVIHSGRPMAHEGLLSQ